MSRSITAELGLLVVVGSFATMGCAGDSVLEGLPADTRDELSTCETAAGLELELLNDFDSAQQASFTFYANPDDPSGTVCDFSGCGKYPKPGQAGPDPGAPVETEAAAETAGCRSGYAVHLQGGGYVSYGPNFGWSVGANAADAVDVSRFSGVSFWAKGGSGAEQIQVMLYDTTTYPVAEAEQRRCVEATPTQVPAPGTGCYNGGRADRVTSASGSWHFYAVDFDEFKQDIWGARTPSGRPDLEHLMRVELKLPVADTFDIWIDNLAWFTR
jgi:hypothetical protein